MSWPVIVWLQSVQTIRSCEKDRLILDMHRSQSITTSSQAV